MTEIEMLMICIGAGFSGIWMMMFYIAKTLNTSLTRLEQRIDRLETRLDSIEIRLTNVDQRVCRIEGALLNKECCMLAHDHKKKAE